MWLRAHADGGIVAVYPLVPWTTPNTDGNPTWTSFNWDTFFLQTVHQHPLYSLPRIEMNPRRSDEIRVLTSDLSNPQTAGILRAEHIRWVLVRDDIYRAIGQTPPAHPPGLREVASLADARIYTPVAAPESPDVAIHARQVELARAYALASAQVSVGSGFYGPEQFNGSTIHWMQQDGHVVLTQLVARPFVEYRLTISAFANARPRRITLAIGGRDIGSFVVGTSTTTYETTVKLPTRVTTLVLHSDPPPNVMSVADPRITSICLVSLAADPVAVEVVPG
jgi:hypothetical protein